MDFPFSKASGTTMMDLLPVARCNSLLKVATMDGVATAIEVYGGRSK